MDDALVLTEGEPRPAHGAVPLFSREPGHVRELASEGMTCILVTHEMRFAREIADEVLFTDGGLIVESGQPAKLFDHPQKDRTRAFLSQIL